MAHLTHLEVIFLCARSVDNLSIVTFVVFLASTKTTQYKSLFREYNISLDDLDSKTLTIGIGHLERFRNRVTESTM